MQRSCCHRSHQHGRHAGPIFSPTREKCKCKFPHLNKTHEHLSTFWGGGCNLTCGHPDLAYERIVGRENGQADRESLQRVPHLCRNHGGTDVLVRLSSLGSFSIIPFGLEETLHLFSLSFWLLRRSFGLAIIDVVFIYKGAFLNHLNEVVINV